MKHHKAEKELLKWKLTEASVARRLWKEDRPVLIVKAVYPMLVAVEASDGETVTAFSEAAMRFNDTYARAAEAFVMGGLSLVGPETESAYDSLDACERASFLRRELTCCMTARREAADKPADCRVVVVTLREQGNRRRKDTVTFEVARHDWHFPHGVWKDERPKKQKTPPKNYEKLLKN